MVESGCAALGNSRPWRWVNKGAARADLGCNALSRRRKWGPGSPPADARVPKQGGVRGCGSPTSSNDSPKQDHTTGVLVLPLPLSPALPDELLHELAQPVAGEEEWTSVGVTGVWHTPGLSVDFFAGR